ncbi:hypothetical protein LX32DRAFT_53545 [Colletotrichum zoysiae]|uniref:Uncharacterized protein n=1 Tax=Colletotrichum zoysiae TaxID=1216348 RepID=A0AAD9LYB8_9PEZI|nr:hypothetical protein LX32DRAFT_53545 [Colletotrichum zoysiae]
MTADRRSGSPTPIPEGWGRRCVLVGALIVGRRSAGHATSLHPIRSRPFSHTLNTGNLGSLGPSAAVFFPTDKHLPPPLAVHRRLFSDEGDCSRARITFTSSAPACGAGLIGSATPHPTSALPPPPSLSLCVSKDISFARTSHPDQRSHPVSRAYRQTTPGNFGYID